MKLGQFSGVKNRKNKRRQSDKMLAPNALKTVMKSPVCFHPEHLKSWHYNREPMCTVAARPCRTC